MLDYNIIWFEDDPDTIKLLKPDFEDYLSELGYELELIDQDDDKNLSQLLEKYDTDLILVDQNLAESAKGNVLINKLRNTLEIYTEVIYYSEVKEFEPESYPLEGVYFATRETLRNKTKKIIDLTIKRNQDIKSVRGLFIAEAIDMANKMKDIIAKILNLDGENKAFFMDEIINEEAFTDSIKYRIIKSYLKNENARLNKKYSSMLKSEKDIRDNVKSEMDKVKEINDLFKLYFVDVIDVRNGLAHGIISDSIKNCIIWKDKEIIYDDERCKKTRKTFLRHIENINKIIKLLNENSE